jgi:hypothetical protein
MPLIKTIKKDNPDDDIIFWQSDPDSNGYRSYVYQFTRKQMREHKISIENDQLLFGETEKERKGRYLNLVATVAETLGREEVG